jgi:hypothetical protein
MEFLDIILKEDSSLLLHAFQFSQSFLLADFKENNTVLFSGFKNPYKKSGKQENLSLSTNSIL